MQRVAIALLLISCSCAAAERVWTGGGADGKWSTEANWDGGTDIAEGDNLRFPSTAARLDMTNDLTGAALPGWDVGTLTFETGYRLSGTAIDVGGTITASAGTTIVSAPLTPSAALVVTVASGAVLQIDGVVGGAAAATLDKQGAGELRLRGANTFVDKVTVNAGTLAVGSAAALGTTAGITEVKDTGRLVVEGGFVLPEALRLEPAAASTAALVARGAGGAIGGTVTVVPPATGAVAIDVDTASSLDLRGAILGTGGFVKKGGGLLRLSADSTLTGTVQVTAGILQADRALVTPFTVDGGTLAGSGHVGAVTVGNGSIQPGEAGVGQLTVDQLTLGAASKLRLRINGPTAATQYGQIVCPGTCTLGGAELIVTMGYAPALTDLFTIIVKASSAATPQFLDLAQGSSKAFNGVSLRISYSGIVPGGTDVVLTPTSVFTPVATTTALGSSPNPAAPGATVVMQAVVSVAGGAPAGTVTFRRGAQVLGVANVLGSTTATFSTAALPEGEHVLTADYVPTGAQLASSGTTTQRIVVGARGGTGSGGSSKSCSPKSGNQGGLAAALLLVARFAVSRRARTRRS